LFNQVSSGNPSYLGMSVGSPGYINGDGFDDALIGAPSADSLSRQRNGAIYVIFGCVGPYVDLNVNDFTTDVSRGFAVYGAVSLMFVRNVEGAIVRSHLGDVNGDGIDDFAFGAVLAPYATQQRAGAVYLIFGKNSTAPVANLDLADLGSNGVIFGGPYVGAQFGNSVASAGDINGDGINDLIIGCYFCISFNGEEAGIVYLIYGSTSLAGMVMASFVTGSSGVRFFGATSYHRFGFAVSGAGDFNGDGIDDFLMAVLLLILVMPESVCNLRQRH
jgi:hypothetical protein